ncbi:hypothetical protein H4582DRAFT_2010983 [Lactarius indigo]|nr:hypothetical protein H4582DRAFT_2010983 [Lactarius indigo]
MSESQSPAQVPPPPPQPQPQHEQSQEPASPSSYSPSIISASARPVSPFFRHRPLGRAPSPPTWACYEQIPARSELLGSSDESDSDSGDEAADEDSLSDADADADPEDPDDGEADDNSTPAALLLGDAVTMTMTTTTTTNGNGDGKSRRPPMSALRPILTIQRSQGFVWNQDLFVPPYIKDRYVASTSPPTSTGVFSACGSTSTSLGDYEIEVVEIRVRDGELDDIIP